MGCKEKSLGQERQGSLKVYSVAGTVFTLPILLLPAGNVEGIFTAPEALSDNKVTVRMEAMHQGWKRKEKELRLLIMS